MDNKRLTLGALPSGTQAVEVTPDVSPIAEVAPRAGSVIVRQKFSHGRTRSVIVVGTTLEPGTHRDKSAKTPKLPPPHANKKGQRASEAKQARSKILHQTKLEALLKQKQEHTRRAIEKEKARKKKLQAHPPNPRPAVNQTRTKEEDIKGKVTELYKMLVSYKAPELRDEAKAKVQRDWLYSVKTKGWAQKHRARLEFALEVLNAVVARRTPANIEMPDGGSFPWPTTKVDGLSGAGIDTPEQELGVLGALGYRVGLKGLDPASRRSLLTAVYRERLHVMLAADYLEEWGQHQTGGRLQKLANTLASLTRNQKRKN